MSSTSLDLPNQLSREKLVSYINKKYIGKKIILYPYKDFLYSMGRSKDVDDIIRLHVKWWSVISHEIQNVVKSPNSI